MAGIIDDRLVGHWSSLAFSYGVMEASDLGFLRDGRGWSTWYNAYALCVTRFQWNCPQPGLLELHTQWLVEGASASQPGRPQFATTQLPEPVDEVTRLHYTIGEAVPIPGAEPLAALRFQEPVESAREFERGPCEITPEDDPSHRILPYTRI